MSELFEHIEKLKGSEAKVAVATLVNTRGTTPRKEGAKMLVGEGGRILGSVTIGGCVDAQVIEESVGVLDRNTPRLLELDLGDEEAWEIGLTCGGTIEVFVEPMTLDRPDAALAFYEKARADAVVVRTLGYCQHRGRDLRNFCERRIRPRGGLRSGRQSAVSR